MARTFSSPQLCFSYHRRRFPGVYSRGVQIVCDTMICTCWDQCLIQLLICAISLPATTMFNIQTEFCMFSVFILFKPRNCTFLFQNRIEWNSFVVIVTGIEREVAKRMQIDWNLRKKLQTKTKKEIKHIHFLKWMDLVFPSNCLVIYIFSTFKVRTPTGLKLSLLH